MALGKGLGALLDDAAMSAVEKGGTVIAEQTLPVAVLKPSSIQPRRVFDDAALKSLSQSIKAQGVIQPLLVRDMNDGSYEIIAGERRWRASQMAGLRDVPVVIRELTDGKALEVALVENIQRDNLNAIDEAEGYLRLVNEFDYTNEEMSRVTGKSRSHISNMMRLLSLQDDVKDMVTAGDLSMGHARAVIPLGDDETLQLKVAKQVVKKGLNVRETEDLVRKHLEQTGKRKGRGPGDAATRELQKRVSSSLGGLDVKIKQKEGVGKITIAFTSQKEMAGLLKTLGVK